MTLINDYLSQIVLYYVLECTYNIEDARSSGMNHFESELSACHGHSKYM
jgi:hypothetical protein